MPGNDPSWSNVLLAFLLAYLAGSIPFGLFIGLARGIDIRKHGSGNIGATNVGRVLGSGAWLTCFTLDFGKGLLPSLAAGAWLGQLGTIHPEPRSAWIWMLIMAGPVLGHMFCPWLKFRGGKGVATGLGAMLGVYPVLTLAGVVAAAVWVSAAALWRYVSLASILGAIVLPLATVCVFAFRPLRMGTGWSGVFQELRGHALPFLAVTWALGAMVVLQHRANIGRLRRGTEPKIGRKKRP